MSTYTSQSGFSLVETLVAITILLIVIVGPMSIISSSAKSTNFASEQVIAFFLAQEGAELAQKARDDILLTAFLDESDGDYDEDPWSTFVDQGNSATYRQCFTANGCGLEFSSGSAGAIQTPILCGTAGAGCNLYITNTNNRAVYTHVATGNTATAFKRQVTFIPAGDSIQVRSKVSWNDGSFSAAVQEIEVETYLFDVYGN